MDRILPIAVLAMHLAMKPLCQRNRLSDRKATALRAAILIVLLPAVILTGAISRRAPVLLAALLLLWLTRRLRRLHPKDCNFTLILAYWQTIRAYSRHRDDVDPRRNPAFDSARNALRFCAGLLPAILAALIGFAL